MTPARRTPALIAALALLASLLLLAGCGSSDSSAPATTTVAIEGLQQLTPTAAADVAAQPGVRVLDVRTPEEFAAGHLAGAQELDFYAPDFAQRLQGLDRDVTWVVYCHTGNRSGQATALMEQQGFRSIVDVAGGIAAWEAAGLPVEKS